MATAELRLLLPLDRARDAVGSALAEQGFTVQPTAGGSLDVSRGSLGTTIVAGAFAGQDMHVRFDVHFTPDAEGTLAAFEHSAVGGFFKGGAIGAARVGEVVRDAAHLAGVRLAQQGVLAGGAAAVPPVPVPAPAAVPEAADGAPAADPAQPAAPEGYSAPPVPPAPPVAPAAPPAPEGYPAYPAPPAAPGGYPVPPAGYGAVAPGIRYGVPAPIPGAEERTNGVAIVALVLGIVVPIGGVIAGSVALAQIKRTGEKGRGLAIAGIIVGAALSALIVVGVIAAVVWGAFASVQGSSADGQRADPYDHSPDAFRVLVGQCFDDLSEGSMSEANLIDCSAPHVYEVNGQFRLHSDTFPSQTQLTDAAEAGCRKAFENFVGISYDESTLDYAYLTPDETLWNDGERNIMCFVTDPAGEVSGTLSNAQR